MPNPIRRTLPIRGGQTNPALSVIDASRVVYSAGKMFDGLGTGTVETETFLRSGALDGVTSRSDLALLEDLRDVSIYIIENRDQPITPPIRASGQFTDHAQRTFTTRGPLP